MLYPREPSYELYLILYRDGYNNDIEDNGTRRLDRREPYSQEEEEIIGIPPPLFRQLAHLQR